MSLLDGYIKIMKGFLAGQDALQIDTNLLDQMMKRSPALRIFMDSDFNSETEIAIKKFIVDSRVNSIRDKLPQGKLSEKFAIALGTRIGNAVNSTLDRVKTFHQYSKGRITIDEYAERRSTQIQASIVNIFKKTKWIARRVFAKQLGFDEKSSTESKIGFGYVIRKVEKGIEKALSSKTTKKVIEASTLTIHAGVTAVRNTYRTVKECVVDPVVQAVGKAVKTGAEKVVEFGHKVENVVKDKIEKAKKWWEEVKPKWL